MADDPHALALLALLDPIPQAVHDGRVPEDVDGNVPDPPWVLVYLNVHYMGQDRLPVESKRAVVRAYCHSVGGSASAARKIAASVRSALLDVRPAVAGRVCNRVAHEYSQPPQRDEKLGPLYMDQVDVYRLESEPS